jgi:hypothetical protein
VKLDCLKSEKLFNPFQSARYGEICPTNPVIFCAQLDGRLNREKLGVDLIRENPGGMDEVTRHKMPQQVRQRHELCLNGNAFTFPTSLDRAQLFSGKARRLYIEPKSYTY